jgi:nucleotide-binding universal stress UspA family protein
MNRTVSIVYSHCEHSNPKGIQMTYKTITLSLKHPENAGRLCAYAAMVARKFNAHLIGVHTAPAFEALPAMFTVANIEQMTSVVEKRKRKSIKIKEIFEQTMASENFISEWREPDAHDFNQDQQFIADWIGSDLIIMGQSNPDRSPRGQNNLIEKAVMNSGRPVLVLPYAGKFETVGETILLGWSGTRESSRAAHDALPFIKFANTTQVFWVGKQNEKTHFIEQTAEQIAIGLDRHGAKVTVTHREPGGISIGDELLNEASDMGADLIVTGGFGHSKVYDFVLGAATNHILKTMTVPVLLAH